MHVFTNISEMQFGFKSKHSTSQCTFVMTEVIHYYNSTGTDVYSVLLDASQAFDRVQYVKLFKLLLQKGICPLYARFLICMYTKQEFVVRWSGCSSNPCTVCNGVKQGGILSPILFIVYIDVLLGRLSASGLGCYIGNVFYGAMGYADDVVLLSPSVGGMDRMLDICSKFSFDYDVLFNATKSKTLIYRSNCGHVYERDVEFTLLNDTIAGSNVEKHLGHVVGNNVENAKIDKAVAELNSRTNMLIVQFKSVPFHILYSLFRSYCMSMYGCVLWDISNTVCNRFFTAWRKNVRRVLRVPYMTHCNLLPLLCDDINIDMQVHSRIAKFLKTCIVSPNAMVSTCMRLAMSGSGSPCSSNISVLSWLYRVPREHIISQSLQFYTVADVDLMIKASIICDLLYMRQQAFASLSDFFSTEQIDFVINTLCTE